MKHNYLNIDDAHNYVERFADRGKTQVFWENYDIVIWQEKPAGYMVKNGMFHNGSWGTIRRVKVSDRGTWRLPVTP